MIARELTRMGCAIQLLTRLPAPSPKAWSEEALARSARYFPLAGLTVGVIAAGVFAFARLALPAATLLPAILAVGVAVLLTGAFHEDGLADSVDGLAGGHTVEQRLAIMKDSRIGTYGAVALFLALSFRIGALTELHSPLLAAGALCAAHGLARAAAVIAMVTLPYASDPAKSRLTSVWRGVRGYEVAIAIVIGAAPLALLPPRVAVSGVVFGAFAAFWPALAAKNLIGGYTGDVLGAVEQAFETAFLVAVAAAVGLALP